LIGLEKKQRRVLLSLFFSRCFESHLGYQYGKARFHSHEEATRNHLGPALAPIPIMLLIHLPTSGSDAFPWCLF